MPLVIECMKRATDSHWMMLNQVLTEGRSGKQQAMTGKAMKRGHPAKVTLKVKESSGEERAYEYTEPDTFILGRSSQGKKVHHAVVDSDRFVSRSHLFVELNPPECYLTDVSSRNGTFVVREAEKKVYYQRGREKRNYPRVALRIGQNYQCEDCQEITERMKIEGGDLICLGETTISVAVVHAPPADYAHDGKIEPESVACIRCGREAANPAGKLAEEIDAHDFLCEACRKPAVAVGEPEKKPPTTCWDCGKDLSAQADADGRAADLQDVALYLCDDCSAALKSYVPIASIGDHAVLAELGEGEFGVVYLARHNFTNRLAALKVVKNKIKRNQKHLRRFRREIAIMSELRHPHLVKLYSDGIYDGDKYYFVSEYLPEGNLDHHCHSKYNGHMPYPAACRLLAQALQGLIFFHSKGFVHRDLRPQNILLRKGASGQLIAKVGDFGLAKGYIFRGSTISMAGEMGGCIEFCAPEQFIDFRAARPVADVYAMGVSLYYLVSGQFPYNFPSRQEIVEQVVRGLRPITPLAIILSDDQPTPIEQKLPDLPQELAAIVNRAIVKDASRRLGSAEEFLKIIERYAA